MSKHLKETHGTVSHQLPVTTICPTKDPETKIVKENSLLKLQPQCNSFIGTTRVFATNEEQNDTIHTNLIIPEIAYDCCEHLPNKEDLPHLKPIRINYLNLDELNTAQEKLNDYNNELNEIINEPFARRHWNTITYVLIVCACLFVLYVFYKCCRKRLIGYFTGSNFSDDGHHPGPCCPQIFNYCNVRSTVSRRPSLHLNTRFETNNEEVVFQEAPREGPLSVSRKAPRRL